jgi:hypothetical protein
MIMNDDRDNGEALCSYFIDMNWYQEQGRSFALLATSRLCPSSQKKKIPKSETALLNTIKQCCSKWEGFVTPSMPLVEMIFRLFLANGNMPLALEEIQEKLQQRLSDSTEPRDLSIPKLKRIIDEDRYYGLRPVTPAEGGEPNTSGQSP